MSEFAGVPAEKLARLHVIAQAALAGELDTDALRAVDPGEAGARVRRLPGVGPFYAELITGRPVDAAGLASLAGGWSPWRTWVCVALRAAGPVALGDQPTTAGSSV